MFDGGSGGREGRSVVRAIDRFLSPLKQPDAVLFLLVDNILLDCW